MSAQVHIVDAGIGNVRSVQRMFEEIDVDAEVATRPGEIADAQRLVIPGVGAFDAAMAALDRGWHSDLDALVLGRRVPVLGVCLGMQLLCRRSEEGEARGLGWIEADVVRLDTGGDRRLKVPHMGWADVRPERPNPLIATTDGEPPRFYHVHKYRVVCDHPTDVIGTAHYGTDFTSAIRRANIFGVQFHPEKSHRFGMELLRRFADLPC